MNFKESYRLERKYYENIYTLLNVLRELKSNTSATEIQKVEELLDNAIADNESIILIYKNLGELYSEVSLRYNELSKLLNDLKQNLENWKDEINNKIDELNNQIMVYIREIESNIDSIIERIENLETANKSWSIPAEQLTYLQEEYKFATCADIQNYNGRRGSTVFTIIADEYQKGLLYSIALYHDSYMNALFNAMPNGSSVTFFIRWEPYYQTNGYNTIGFREMFSVTKDSNGLLSFAPVYSSMGEMEMWGKRGFIRLVPSEETLKITYQFDIIWQGNITKSTIDNVIKNSLVLNIQN